MTATEKKRKLPLWRLIAALFVLGSLGAVLSALAPVYLDNYRFQKSLRDMVRTDTSHDDETLQFKVLSLARQFNLPVYLDQIDVEPSDGKVQVDVKYAVLMVLPLYRVDLHFHASATGE